MADWLDKAERQLKTHATTLHGIEIIGRLIRDALLKPGSDAHVVLRVIERVIDTLIAGHDGEISSESILEEFDRIKAMHIAGEHPNDVAADTALDDKFKDK